MQTTNFPTGFMLALVFSTLASQCTADRGLTQCVSNADITRISKMAATYYQKNKKANGNNDSAIRLFHFPLSSGIVGVAVGDLEATVTDLGVLGDCALNGVVGGGFSYTNLSVPPRASLFGEDMHSVTHTHKCTHTRSQMTSSEWAFRETQLQEERGWCDILQFPSEQQAKESNKATQSLCFTFLFIFD